MQGHAPTYVSITGQPTETSLREGRGKNVVSKEELVDHEGDRCRADMVHWSKPS